MFPVLPRRALQAGQAVPGSSRLYSPLLVVDACQVAVNDCIVGAEVESPEVRRYRPETQQNTTVTHGNTTKQHSGQAGAPWAIGLAGLGAPRLSRRRSQVVLRGSVRVDSQHSTQSLKGPFAATRRYATLRQLRHIASRYYCRPRSHNRSQAQNVPSPNLCNPTEIHWQVDTPCSPTSIRYSVGY